ncbi:MAG TPA: DEAD/DEAH box helicase [Blastocatellia bacterium]|nr:DEAD/DEAH box helicase [Blastocatellia bacterium]
MIIFHAAFHDGQLWLWGETPAQAEIAGGKSGGRSSAKAKSRREKSSPYDAGGQALLAALAEVTYGLRMGEDAISPATAWLPSIGDQPIASSPLIADAPSADVSPTLAPWRVTAIPLRSAEAVDLLCGYVGREVLGTGIIAGRDLAFWAQAMRFAGSLLARQQFLPDLEPVEDFYRAQWRPVFAGADAARFSALAKAMPHACRALTTTGSDGPPMTSAQRVLDRFIGEMVDYLARSAVREMGASGANRRNNHVAESVHDQWMQALRGPDGVIDDESPELATLARQVCEWRRPVSVSTLSPFRLCFRLEEPPEAAQANGESVRKRSVISDLEVSIGRSDWYVRYLLQSVDDPSLLIDVSDAWNAKGRAAAALKRGKFNSREFLLSALGQAAGLSPEIEQSLKNTAPGGYGLGSSEAYQFLTEKAWLLDQAGFGVLLPAWWTRKGTKLRLSMRANVKSPKMQGGSRLSLEKIIQFDWEVALGDQVLSLKELEALASLKTPLVRMRGQWVQLSADEIQAALDFWRNRRTGRATAREIVQMALGKADAPGGVKFEGVQAQGWIGDLLAQLEGNRPFAEMEVPAEFNGTLRPYQVRGYSWLVFLKQWELGACLADDMGLGKSAQTLALVEREWLSNGHCPTLIVCPTSVISNWQKEAERFTPNLPVMVHHGVTRAKGAAFKKEATRHAMVISSYSLLQRDAAILQDLDWGMVVLDEAQNIKNPETKQARAARSLKAGFRIALTGTPVENNVGDLWSIMEFLNPGMLGSQTEFKRVFFAPIQVQRDQEASQRLKRLTGPFILRRLKTDKKVITDLPEKMEMKVFCNLTKEQATLYAAVVKEADKSIEESEGIKRKGVVLATLSKLKQVCNHPAQFLGDNSAIPGRSGKLARLTEMLEEALSSGERALIFTQFAEMGQIIQRHLQEMFGHETLFLHGAVAKKQRDRMVERFQAAGGPSLFVLSLKAGGTGLNLTAASHVFHFDRWWNPAVENQATDRAFRIGQTRNVQVHKFVCGGTLEEKIDEMIEHKKEIAGSIVGAGESWLTELSTVQLRKLFALGKDAVGE